jgi:hypothetical protein
MVDYLLHHHFLLLPLLHLQNLEWKPSFYPSFHHMQKHMPCGNWLLSLTHFSRHLKDRDFPNHNGRGHCTQVLHVVKNSDDAPVSLLW